MTPQTPPTDRPLTAGDWIEWHGGENPVPGQKIHWRNAHGAEHGPVLSNEVCGFGFPSMPGSATIIAYRLARPATSAASEGEGDDLDDDDASTHAMSMAGLSDYLWNQALAAESVESRGILEMWREAIDALASPPVSERERVFMVADDVPVWADGIVTDGERAAIAQKAEADHGGTYWAVDGGDGALDWEPTHFISIALLTAQPAGEGK